MYRLALISDNFFKIHTDDKKKMLSLQSFTTTLSFKIIGIEMYSLSYYDIICITNTIIPNIYFKLKHKCLSVYKV